MAPPPPPRPAAVVPATGGLGGGAAAAEGLSSVRGRGSAVVAAKDHSCVQSVTGFRGEGLFQPAMHKNFIIPNRCQEYLIPRHVYVMYVSCPCPQAPPPLDNASMACTIWTFKLGATIVQCVQPPPQGGITQMFSESMVLN